MLNKANDPLENAVFGLALAADSLLVNGVTIGCAPLGRSTKGFITKLTQTGADALDALSQATSTHRPALKSAMVPLTEDLRNRLNTMGDWLLILAKSDTLAQDEIDSAITALQENYSAVKCMIQQWEELCATENRFYESRSQDSAQRIEQFLNELPQFFTKTSSKDVGLITR